VRVLPHEKTPFLTQESSDRDFECAGLKNLKI